MDGPPAQSLGVEPVDHDIMRQPPRRPEEPIITRPLMGRVLLAAFVIFVGTFAVFYSEYDIGADEAAIRHDTTMTFTTFVMFAMFFAAACRSVSKSVFTLGLTSNPMFLVAVGSSVACQVAAVYLPLLQSVFHTVPLSFADWTRVLTVSSSVLLVDELRKLVSRLLPNRSLSALSQPRLASAASDSINHAGPDSSANFAPLTEAALLGVQSWLSGVGGVVRKAGSKN
jgi:Ca2+-transporting ATPase